MNMDLNMYKCNLLTPVKLKFTICIFTKLITLAFMICRTISELNAKTDQITEGLAALAQIYIDNYHFTYRSNHEGQEPFLKPSHIPPT